jgi:hypothetical protein
MHEPPPTPDYRIVVTRRPRSFELRIDELALRSRGATLEEAYRRLIGRRTKVLEWAAMIGLLNELPTPMPHTIRSFLAPR